MTLNNNTQSQRYYARIAGLTYIIVILLGIFSVNFIVSSILVPGDELRTIRHILDNILLFRISIASEIIMYVLVILLSASLYITLKVVDENLALLALLWRLGEAIVGAVTVILSGLILLLLAKSGSDSNSLQLQTLIRVFTDIRAAGLDVVLIFIGIGGTLFFYLFLKSGYIPKILAYWGIITYLSMLLIALLSILLHDLPASTKMAFFIPGGIFEIIVGLWLLIKGIK